MQFQLERFLLLGPVNQLLFIAGLILLISALAGAIVHAGSPHFPDFSRAVWWGFLRLTDPGYLGDDIGPLPRIVSTIVTVLGYVLFMGALVAIMTQALHRALNRLEAGLTPLVRSGHVLVLGWTNRTAPILRELLLSKGRNRRFLEAHDLSGLHVVVLAQSVSTRLVHDLRDELGPLWDSRAITLRQGDPLRPEHLGRADFMNAAAIVLPAGPAGRGEADPDARTVKVMLSISRVAERAEAGLPPPMLVSEILDPRKEAVALHSYRGPAEVVTSAAIMSRLLAQNIRHGGLSYIFRELLTYAVGNEIYIRDVEGLAGRSFGSLRGAWPRAIPLGLLRPDPQGRGPQRLLPMLAPAADTAILAGDRLVFLAADYEAAAGGTADRLPQPAAAAAPAPQRRRGSRTVLLLGWNRRAANLLEELQSYDGESFVVDAVSRLPAARRWQPEPSPNLRLTHLEADYTDPDWMAGLDPARYDTLLFLASDWLDSDEEADARTILGHVLLTAAHGPALAGRPLLVELSDPDNEPLFGGTGSEVLVTPMIVSQLMAHIALRPDLALVFEDLFTSGGAEFLFRPPAAYGLPEAGAVPFAAIRDAAAATGEIALGLYDAGAGPGAGCLRLNPEAEAACPLTATAEIVVLGTGAGTAQGRAPEVPGLQLAP